MYTYDFIIAGLLLRVKSEFALRELFELSHFLTGFDPLKQPDATYHLRLLPKDWIVCGECILKDRQNAVYQWKGEEHRYFYWNVFSQNRFVLLRYSLDDLRNCTIYLQPEDAEQILPQFRLSAFFSAEQILLRHNAFQLHASVIDWQGQGILFTAPSGTGKSTQADLWQRLEGAQILNGDRAIIRHMEDGFVVYGSPYAGSSGIYTNRSVPIRAIVVLSQAPDNTIKSVSAVAAFQQLYRESTVRTWDPPFVDALSKLLLELIAEVPVYHLACRPDDGAVSILKKELM